MTRVVSASAEISIKDEPLDLDTRHQRTASPETSDAGCGELDRRRAALALSQWRGRRKWPLPVPPAVAVSRVMCTPGVSLSRVVWSSHRMAVAWSSGSVMMSPTWRTMDRGLDRSVLLE